MLRILNEEERKRIRDAYGQHPLYAACTAVFRKRRAHLNGLDVQAEDVFCAIVHFLDTLYNTEEELTQEDIDILWDDLCNNIRDAKVDASEHDKRQIVHTVFAIVRKTLCHHWDTYFRETLFDMLGTTIEREMKEADEEEMERFVGQLIEKSDALKDWVNIEYDGEMSEEIEKYLPQKGDGVSNQVFHDNLDEGKIVSALRRIQRRDCGDKQFAQIAKEFFESIGWLTNRKDTDFVSWMNSQQLTYIKSKGLTHVTLNSNTDDIRNELKTTFQYTNGRGCTEDVSTFYKPNKIKINKG